MQLLLLDFIQGFFGLVFVIISFIVGLLILSKYFKYRKVVLILIGLSWIGMCVPWLGDAVNFLSIIFTGESIAPFFAFLISFAFLPGFVLCWLIAFMNLTNKKNKAIVLTAYIILGAIFEAIFLYLLFTDVRQLGVYKGIFQVEFSPFLQLYLILNIAIVLITGFIFSRISLKSSDPEIKLKGKFLLMAFITFTIGALLDAAIPLTSFTVVITRVVLMISAVLFYIGFILPESIKNHFLK